MRDPDDTLRRVEERAGPLLRRGAQAIVLGCMSFGFHPFARELSQRLGVPVVDALRAGIAAAYACTLLGVGPSAAAHPPLDEPERLAAYLADLRGAPAAT